ncbi:hypothetical protein I3843_05G020400, partial [Carya illinoinensis]
MHFILSPVRILKKAAEFYVKSMDECAGRVGYGGAVGYHAVNVTHLPKSFSVNSSKGSDDEDVGQISRTVSKKSLEKKAGTETENGMGIRSYSVGLGKIGRIDEDRPCCFDEDGVIVKADLYPRSRSYAVNRNISVY